MLGPATLRDVLNRLCNQALGFFVYLTFFSPLQVTAVGLNTEWGLLMASVSEDNNEETPLQVSPFYLLLMI